MLLNRQKQFTAATEVNALAITKLDGTAKGGVVIGISDQFKTPVKYIGLGEGMEDLQVFHRKEFVDSLFRRRIRYVIYDISHEQDRAEKTYIALRDFCTVKVGRLFNYRTNGKEQSRYNNIRMF